MITITSEKIQEWSKTWHKGPLSDAALDAVESNKDVVMLAADLAMAVGVYDCIKYEGQYFNLGIAEQNMLGMACGLAKEGKIPVATSFVPFIALRAFEQVRTSAAYMELNVKMIGTNGGVRGGKAGTSHYGLEDLTIMRCVPGMTVLSPSDGLCMYKAIRAMIDCEGPAYLRVAGVPEVPILYKEDFDYRIGEAVKHRDGEEVAMFATGPMVARALDAAGTLAEVGIEAAVYDVHTIKPLDEKAVLEAAEKAKLVVTLEENTIIGGLGGAVAELLAQSGTGARLKIMGLMDKFMKIATYEDQLRKCGLLPDQIAETVQEGLGKAK